MGAPKKILFTSTEHNYKVSTNLVPSLGFGQQRTDIKAEGIGKGRYRGRMPEIHEQILLQSSITT